MGEARERSNQLSAELESALQANQNCQSELNGMKSLNEQLTEQNDVLARDKHRLQGSFFIRRRKQVPQRASY